MKPSAFCTIATNGAMKDLLALVNSMSLYMPGSRLYVLCDTETKEFVERDYFPNKIDIRWKISLNAYTNKNREQMEKEKIWSDFQMEKTNSLLWAFEEGEPDVMFLDADLFILKGIVFEGYSGEDVALSPHGIRKVFEDKYGKYNGGVFWTKNKDAIQTWRDHFVTSRYYDQACLEDVARIHSTYEFHMGYNMSWWRIFQGDQSPNELVQRFSLKDDELYYGDHPVYFIHTHLYDDPNANPVVRKMTLAFNKLMVDIYTKTKDIRTALLLLRHIQERWNVIIPKQPVGGIWNHTNDSFRELAKMWNIKKLAKLEEVEKIGNCWFGAPGLCLLYDRDTLKWYGLDPLAQSSRLSLIANPSPDEIPSENGKNLPWIYWARRPVLLESRKNTLRTNEKDHSIVFIGNIENSVQGQYRNTNWGEHIDDFHLTNGGNYKFTHAQYLDRISRATFGLCLRGYGTKCHRETELMGVGTIPIITPECDVSSYANPLVEGVHYVRVNEPSDIPEIIQKITPEKIQSMRENCIEWWETNCSLEGSFRTTLQQIFLG
jgi:hypothetical protein